MRECSHVFCTVGVMSFVYLYDIICMRAYGCENITVKAVNCFFENFSYSYYEIVGPEDTKSIYIYILTNAGEDAFLP